MIEQQMEAVSRRIEQACIRSGRNPDEVTLIAVSKTKPIELLREVYSCGVREFGENKVQEITEKVPAMPEDCNFHMIGHLQSNKIRQVLRHVTLIHSIDSIRLAEQLNREAQKESRIMRILLEVNVAGEESKYGFELDAVSEAVKIISRLSHIKICGLMTIAPFVENPEENRPVFKKLYQLSVDIKSKNIDNVSMSVLSMGMTGDYEVAIEEGATMIRVGTGIFGIR